MFVVVDIETTGLEPEKDIMLEFGMSIFDSNDFTMVGHYSTPLSVGSLTKEDLVRKMPDVVLQMHSKSGLLDDLFNSPVTIPRVAEMEAIDLLKTLEATNLPLTGSTISFDRAFLKKYMPNLEATFHYRNIDVSSLKILADMYQPGKWTLESSKTHRVAADIQDSLNALQYFAENYTSLLPPPAAPPAG